MMALDLAFPISVWILPCLGILIVCQSCSRNADSNFSSGELVPVSGNELDKAIGKKVVLEGVTRKYTSKDGTTVTLWLNDKVHHCSIIKAPGWSWNIAPELQDNHQLVVVGQLSVEYARKLNDATPIQRDFSEETTRYFLQDWSLMEDKGRSSSEK